MTTLRVLGWSARLKNTSVVITCYDRNGNEIKRVTSTDDGTVADNDEGTTGENDGVDGTEGGNQNQGGSNPEPGNGGGDGGTEDGTDES